MAFVILLIILKFSRVGRYFLMRYSGFEASMDSVRGNLSRDTFICAEFAAFPGKGCDLHPILLNYTVHTLLIDRDSLLSEFSMYAAITIVFVCFAFRISLIFRRSSVSGSSRSSLFCQYIYVAFGKQTAARMSFSLNSPRRLWTILAVFSEELPLLNAVSSFLLKMHSRFGDEDSPLAVVLEAPSVHQNRHLLFCG